MPAGPAADASKHGGCGLLSVSHRPAWCSSSRSTYDICSGFRTRSYSACVMLVAHDSTFSLDVIHRFDRGTPDALMAAAMVGCEP